MMKLPEQIKKYRHQSNLSQEELANKIYVSRQTISNWENDRSYPDVENLLILSSLFDVSLDNLVKGDLDFMKRELNKHAMDKWTKVMLIFLLLGSIIGIPATYIMGKMGLVIALVLLAIGEAAAIKVERVKRKYDLKTYQEIVAFTENRELNSKEKSQSRQSYWKRELLMILGSILIMLILSSVVIVITRLFIK